MQQTSIKAVQNSAHLSEEGNSLGIIMQEIDI